MRNVHIYPSAFTHESRILREASTLRKRLGAADISLVGVASKGLPTTEQVSEGIVIRRLGPAKGVGAMKSVRHLLWCLHVFWFCIRLSPSIVNCHSLPVLPIGVAIKALTGTRLVYDAHELETETAGSSVRRRRIGRMIERACIRFVDLLIVVSPGIESWYRQQYSIDNVVTVLNTPSYRQFTASAVDLYRNLGIENGRKIVLYQGALAPGRGIEPLIAAAHALDAAGYRLVLMGYGPLEEKLRKQSEEMRFHLHPAVPSNVLLDYTAAAHIGLCLIEDTCLSYHLSLPNKLFEYVMAGLLIVASNLPEIRSVVESNRIGACIPGWDVQSIVETVQKVDAMRDGQMAARLRRTSLEYNWERQEDRMIDAYNSFVLTNHARW